ncbi:hypothetical protein HPS36_09790 [Halorubrum salinarum]|uniref:Uncharacterized protein n=1 Tax=Halorubrum salinarum TaxID=2739057 RepID=A0A7D4BSE5_9EURY|nr:hypothetical protein [Halorubrum salinarum]QKG93140.1 hypothetical protein HPS36_09790 [Halorubrum salinarum]
MKVNGLEAAAEPVREKTGIPTQAREFVGTTDAPPAKVCAEPRWTERVCPNTLASIKFDSVDSEPVWELGSCAYRPEKFFGI